MSAKRVDGLACLWKKHLYMNRQDYRMLMMLLIFTFMIISWFEPCVMCLNQQIILWLNDGIKNCNNLASFGALSHCDEVSLLWYTIHLRSYCLREYGSFHIPVIWQDLPILSEAIVICLKFFVSATKIIWFYFTLHCSLLLIIYMCPSWKITPQKLSH